MIIDFISKKNKNINQLDSQRRKTVGVSIVDATVMEVTKIWDVYCMKKLLKILRCFHYFSNSYAC